MAKNEPFKKNRVNNYLNQRSFQPDSASTMSLVASANMRLKKKKKKTASTLVDATAIGGASPSHEKSKPPSSASSSLPSQTSPRGATTATGTVLSGRGNNGSEGDFARTGGADHEVNGINHPWMQQQQQQQHTLQPSYPLFPSTATPDHHNNIIRHPSPLPVHQQLFQQPHQHFDTATQQRNVTNYLSPRHPGRAPNRPRRGHDSFIDSPPTGGSNKVVLVGDKSGNKAFDPTLQQMQFQSHNSQQQQQQKPHPQPQRQESAFDPFAPSPLTLPNINTSNSGFSNANNSFHRNGLHYPKADATSSSYFQKEKLLPMQQSGGETNIPSSNMHNKNSSNTPPMLANHTDFEYHTDNDDDNDNTNDNAADDDEVVKGEVFHYDNNDRSGDYDNDNEEEDTTNSTPSPKLDSMMMMRMMLLDKEDQTIDSERALHGTPVKKKKKKLLACDLHHQERHPVLLPSALTKGSCSEGKKNRKGGNGHRKKSKVIIDNVDEFTNYQQQQQQQQQYQHHHQHLYSEDITDEGSDVGVGEVQHGRIESNKLLPTPTTTTTSNTNTNTNTSATSDAGGGDVSSSTKIARTKMLDIAAHARKLASDGIILDSFIETSADTAVGTHDEDEDGTNTRHYISPRRIGKSKSHDSEDGNNFNSNHTSRNVMNASTISFSRILRDDDDDDDYGNIRIRREREMFLRTSKSWDDDGGASKQRRNFFDSGSVDDNNEKGIAHGGTWENENTSISGVNSTGGGREGNYRATNLWGNDFNFDSNLVKKNISTSGSTSRRQQGSLSRASKSWDDDGISDNRRIGSDKGFIRWGTWGDEHTSLFGVDSTATYDAGDNLGVKVSGKGGGEGQVMSSAKESLTDQEHDTDNSLSANVNMLEEWDKAEAQFRETISADSRKAGSPLPSLHQQGREQKIDRISPRTNASKSHPWSSDEQSMVFEGLDSRSSISRDLRAQSTDVENTNSIVSTEDGNDDDDSIFVFGTKDHAQPKRMQELSVSAEPAVTEKRRLQPSPLVNNPADIFNKIKSGLKQADKTKNRARGIQGNESDVSCDPSDTSNDARHADDESASAKIIKPSLELDPSTIQTPPKFHDLMMTEEDKKIPRIKFATDTQNTVHTYWAESEEKLSDIDKFGYVDEKDGNRSVGNNKIIQSNSVRSEKIVESNKSMSFRQPEEGSDNDTYGDSTVEDSITYKSGQSDDLRKEALDELDLTILDHVDNAVTAVAATLGGLFGVGPAQKQPAHNENNGRSGASAENRRLIATEDDAATSDTDTYGESTAFTTINTGTTRTDGSEYDWLDYMRSFIFPKDLDGDTSVVSGDSKDEESTFPEDEDSFMFQQALAAARAIHHVQGIEFDETQDINVLTDIKFLVVTVALPLGLLFQEHEIGVWVSQAIPGGNGAENGVQHGDQLAAVNGNSSVHTTLDEVATKINSTPSNRAVELTFLRYVGPLRPVPGSIIQQGFEVTDKSVSPQRKSLPSLFLKKKRSGDMSESPTSSALQSKSEPFLARKAAATAAASSSLVASPSRTKSSGAAVMAPSSPSQTNKKKLSLGKLLSFKRKT